MGQIWLAYCEDAYYGRVREEVLRRGGDARIARVNSAEGAIQLGRACATGSVGVIVACGASAIDAYANDVLRLRSELGGCELLALSIGGGPVCAARLLQAGATEVIAEDDDVDGGRRPVGSGAATDCHGDVGGTAVGCGAPPCEADLVPVEELWPPLDEPDGQVVPMAPVTSSGDEPMGGAPFDAAPEAAWGNRPDGPHCEDAAAPAVAGSLREIAAHVSAIASMGEGASRAPLVTVVSGRGGVGKTTLVAALAACSARAGLRAAVLDLDLMCGDLPSVFGVDGFKGMEGLVTHERDGVLAECDVEATAMRIGPGLTLWGPLAEGERAELFGGPVEQLIGVLRGAANIIFADTSCCWGDAVAVAVAACDRCLVVGSGGETSGTSASRVVNLAARLGVPATRLTSVFNKMGGRGCGEDEALRFEMGASLCSRVRIAAGGDDVSGMLSFGKLDALLDGDGAFARDIRAFTASLLGELGCPAAARVATDAPEPRKARFGLPWRKRGGATR